MKFSRLTASCLLFLLVFAWSMFLLGIFQPGFITDNGKYFLEKILIDQLPITSIFYKSELFVSLVYLSIKFHGDFNFYFIFLFLIAAFSLSYFYYLVSPIWSKKWSAFWVLLIIMIPTNSLFLMETEREVIFAWLSVLTLLQLFDFAFYQQSKLSWRRAVLLSFTAIIAGFIRPEGFLYAAFLPLQIAYFSNTQKLRHGFKVLVSIVFFFGFFSILINQIYTSPLKEVTRKEYLNEYLARQSLFIIEQAGGILSDEDKRILSPFVKLDKVQNTPIESEEKFREIFLRTGQSPEMQSSLKSYYFKMLFSHPVLFLSARWIQFIKTTNQGLVNIYFLPSKDRSFWPEFRDWYLNIYNQMSDMPWLKYFFVMIPMAVILNLMVLLCAPWLRGYAFFYTAPMIHIFIIILVQATGKPKYFYFSYLCAFIFAPIFILKVVELFKGHAKKGEV